MNIFSALYFVQHLETICDFSFVVLLAFPFAFALYLSAGDVVDADDASYRLKCIICNFTALDYHFLMTVAFASLLGLLGWLTRFSFPRNASRLRLSWFSVRSFSASLGRTCCYWSATTAPIDP